MLTSCSSSLSGPNKQDRYIAEKSDSLGSLPDVWLQIDRQADRLVPLFGSGAGQYNFAAGEVRAYCLEAFAVNGTYK